MKKILLAAALILMIASTAILTTIFLSWPKEGPDSPPPWTAPFEAGSDQELAFLLVKLELKTRAVIAAHYNRPQSALPGIDLLYKRWLAKNLILPAAVANGIFSEVVPGATGGRAWVKMVVEKPRNPDNRADASAMKMLEEIIGGEPFTARSEAGAFYYAEPIRANSTCLPCHGDPKGESDPLFPQFKKDGWRDGQVVGAVVARVAAAR